MELYNDQDLGNEVVRLLSENEVKNPLVKGDILLMPGIEVIPKKGKSKINQSNENIVHDGIVLNDVNYTTDIVSLLISLNSGNILITVRHCGQVKLEQESLYELFKFKETKSMVYQE